MRTIRIDFNVDDTQPSISALMSRVFGAGQSAVFHDDLLIDLENCAFLGPSAVVVLGGLRRLAQTRGRTITIQPPSLDRLLGYCQYSGLLADFGVGPGPEPHPDNATTPLHSFAGALPLGGISEIVALARREMQLSRTAEDDLKLVLAELAQNVLDHSQSPIGGLLSARAYKNLGEVRLAVADFGVGIRHSLARRFDIATDKAAIEAAFKEEVTSRSSTRNLGLGLAHLHEIVKITGGRMVLCSGGGFLKLENRRDRFGSAGVHFPGTIAFVRLPARTVDDEEARPVVIWQ